MNSALCLQETPPQQSLLKFSTFPFTGSRFSSPTAPVSSTHPRLRSPGISISPYIPCPPPPFLPQSPYGFFLYNISADTSHPLWTLTKHSWAHPCSLKANPQMCNWPSSSAKHLIKTHFRKARLNRSKIINNFPCPYLFFRPLHFPVSATQRFRKSSSLSDSVAWQNRQNIVDLMTHCVELGQ